MAMKKKAAPADEGGEHAPMWIVSFADLVTLMMSFFVVLYALKQGGKDAEISLATAIADRFGREFPMDASDPYAVVYWRKHGVQLAPLQKEPGAADKPARGVDGMHSEVTQIRPGDMITSGGTISFEPGKAELDAASKETIGKLYEILRGHNNVLLIKGHISSDEVSLRPDDCDGMSLSYRRAKVVAEELARLGLDRRVLRPMACGPFEPVKVAVYDTASQKANRRAEVFTTDTIVSDFFPPNVTPATTRGTPASAPASKPAPQPKAIH